MLLQLISSSMVARMSVKSTPFVFNYLSICKFTSVKLAVDSIKELGYLSQYSNLSTEEL
jgi:hypothetical protein